MNDTTTMKSTEQNMVKYFDTTARKLDEVHWRLDSNDDAAKGLEFIDLFSFSRESLLLIAGSCWLAVDRLRELGDLCREIASDKK